MRVLTCLLIVTLGVAVVAATEPAGPVLRLRVYDGVPLTAATARGLRAATEAALARTGIELRWYACAERYAGRQRECQADLTPRNVVVRIIESHDGLDEKRCGFALPARSASGFISLSRACAARAAAALSRTSQSEGGRPATEAEVLGYTLAHELAHVLLPGARHSREGLFRARLERVHWNRVGHGGLVFLPRDVKRLREAATRHHEADAPPGATP